jgi:hypothetical protein
MPSSRKITPRWTLRLKPNLITTWSFHSPLARTRSSRSSSRRRLGEGSVRVLAFRLCATRRDKSTVAQGAIRPARSAGVPLTLTLSRREREQRLAVLGGRYRQSRVSLKQPGLAAAGSLEAQNFVAQFRRHAALRGAVEVAFHDEERLIDFLQSVRLLAHGDGQGT